MKELVVLLSLDYSLLAFLDVLLRVSLDPLVPSVDPQVASLERGLGW